MKRKFLCICVSIIILVTLLITNVTFAQVDLEVNLGSTSANLGSTIYLPIDLGGSIPMGIDNMQIKVLFNPNVFSGVGITPGSIVANPSANFSYSIDNTNGFLTILFADQTCGGQSITSIGRLANIEFNISSTAALGTYDIMISKADCWIGTTDMTVQLFDTTDADVSLFSSDIINSNVSGINEISTVEKESNLIVSSNVSQDTQLITDLGVVSTKPGSSKSTTTVATASTLSTTSTGMIGDVSADGNVNSIDFAILRQYLLGMITNMPAYDDIWCGDVTGDNLINSLDFAQMRRYLLGIITVFPKANVPNINIVSPLNTYNIFNPAGTYIRANVTNNTTTPTLSFNNTLLGTMIVESTSGYYGYSFCPSTNQRGFGTSKDGQKGELRSLSVSAKRYTLSNSSYKYVYFSELSYNQIRANAPTATVEVKGVCDKDYNCTAYALGIDNEWLFPTWMPRNATYAETDTFMSRYGYERCAANQAQIVAYGDADEISHFARRNVDNTTVAKWGAYEVIYTAGINVYASLSAGGYGEPRLYYKKTH